MIEVNEYFEGKVKSLALQTETLPATVGVMLPGDYVFSTAAPEKMTVVSGAMTIKLGDAEAVTYRQGESFEVAADTSFDVHIDHETAYLCLYG